MKKFFLLTAIIGIFIFGFSGLTAYKGKINEIIKTAEAKILIKNKVKKDVFKNNLREGELSGVIEIPRLKKELPIFEGTDDNELDQGVGHFSRTAMPGDGKQILLSGHRDTVFTGLGELESGDEIIVKYPYGEFTYYIEKTKITDAKDPTIIDLGLNEEELVLSTCYPFNFIGSAPDRYIIYAYPKDV